MTEFHSTLLREKFVIHDDASKNNGDSAIIALSNRLLLPLVGHGVAEHFIIRAQNMHLATRIAAQIAKDFAENGAIIDRKKLFDWHYAYLSVIKGYEKTWNPHRWVAIYHKGRLVYQDGETEHHPFLDVIEQCDAHNKGEYAHSLEIAKDAFRKAGKNVTIEYDANVAMILSLKDGEAKCGVILRGPNKTTTFNLTARPRAGRDVKISQCLSVAAAFLEGIQLAFLIGMTKQKLKYKLIAPLSPEEKKADDASRKLGRLNGAVTQFENILNVTYRPERPNFSKMIDEAEEFSRKVLANEVKTKIASGDVDGGDWVT